MRSNGLHKELQIYLSQVLGVGVVLKPNLERRMPLIAVGECARENAPEILLMRQRMIRALGFAESEIEWRMLPDDSAANACVEQLAEQSAIKKTLVFGAEIENRPGSLQVLSLPALSAISADENLKRKVWNQMRSFFSTAPLVLFLFGMVAVLALFQVLAPAAEASEGCTTELAIEQTISPATVDWVDRALKHAEREGCTSVLMTVNTPGGVLESARQIVQRILSSPIPVLCIVSPEGGHAGSAGALIMLSCHVSGALLATNIGAATPIAGSGTPMSDDLRKKMVEDTRSWAASLARKRRRSIGFAEKIVTEALALDAVTAVKEGAIDILAKSKDDFLNQARGREVQLIEERVTKVVVGTLMPVPTDLRARILQTISDPEMAYLMFMASLGLLYFEITHPGVIAPGVAGGLLLVTSLIAFHRLDVSWGAVALIFLGVCFLIAEIFVPSFGALGIGGILALAGGSALLYDPVATGVRLPLKLLVGVPVILGLLMLGVGYLASRIRRGESLNLTGFVGIRVEVDASQASAATNGQVQVNGELWQFECHEPVQCGDWIQVTSVHGLRLKVKKTTPPDEAETRS